MLINDLGGVEGFGENALPPNDDGSSSPVNITAVFDNGLNFFGETYTNLYINNNGNVTFNGPLGSFTPAEITAGFGNPIIAVFWADVDTRGGPGIPTGGNATGSNTVYWDLDPVNGAFTVTWDDVGYYSGHNDKLDAFQLRLIDQGGGNFDIEFRYEAINWTTGDASGGLNGLNDPTDPLAEAAHAGFSAGDDINFYELPQSGDQDAMLGIDSNPAPPGTQGGTSEIGVYRFEVRNGVVPPPAPTGLTLSPTSDSGKPGDNRTNDTTPTIIGGGGISGNTIALFADGTVVGTDTVATDGSWSVTASLFPILFPDGGYSLTATQFSGAAASSASAPLFVTIDTSAPTTVPVSHTVQPNTPAAEIGIPLPTDPDDDFSDPDQAPTILVSTLPSNGAVTLDGVTPVSLGQQLTTSQLTALDFTPTGQTGTASSFTYTVTDLAGNTSSGTATFTIAAPPPPPPAPTGLTLSPTSDSGKPGDNRTNDTTPTIIGGGGISGNTIALFADGTVVGTDTVATDGSWSVTASLFPILFPDGGYSLTATQFSGAAASSASAPLFVTIDTSAPTTVPVSHTVQPNTPAAEIGIPLPTDPDDDFSDPDQAPTILVSTLPSNGAVTLDGVTPVSLGQQLTTSQLTALDFTPTGQTGTASSFTYTVTDLAGNTSSGTATFTIAAPPIGGRWIFSPDTVSGLSGVLLGINNGIAPVFPSPQVGKLNIEVFTNPALATVPGPDPGFQAALIDPGGTLDDGFLTGTDLRLGSGNFLAVDSVTGASAQSPSKITLGTGKQTVVGARFDTLIGGSGDQILSALIGNETVVGGTGNESVWGGANDFIIAGSGSDNQIVVTGLGTTVVAGTAGNATISVTTGDTVIALAGSQNVVISAASTAYIDLTGNTGFDGVIGSSGDTIIGGDGTTNVEGVNGGMLIKVGTAGTTNVSGSGNSVAGGNTIIGGSGQLNFNPSLLSGAGDLIDLSGSSGTAQINAFSFHLVRSFGHDTILGANTADSVFGGDGDRIGTGKGPVVGGTHQWVHADTVAGSAVGFGSNDTVSSTIYETVTGIATRGTVSGTSSALVTVGGFNTTTDFLFYQNETALTTNAIVATSQATIIGGTPSTIITLPDGTLMTLVGVIQTQLTPALFKI